jgi:ribosomal protein S18 acetylase RimI-like enzyme
MNSNSSTNKIRSILEKDRKWSAYALADLDPKYKEFCRWLVNQDSLILIYKGLDPPVLFAIGQPSQLEILFSQVPGGRYTYTLMGFPREIVKPRLKIEIEHHMWRMTLKADEFPGTQSQAVVKLGLEHFEAIQGLVSGYPDQPDSFTPMQLELGPFYGLFEGEELVSMAGVHIQSHWASVAAIGNVYTRPDRRGRGYATNVTASVIEDVLSQGIQTVVLNVGMNNHPALTSYHKLGFWPYCGYYEGTGTISGIQENRMEN